MKTKLQSIIERVVAYGIVVVCIIILIYYFGTVNKRQNEMGKAKNAELANIRAQYDKAIVDKNERFDRVDKIDENLKTKEKELADNFDAFLVKSDNYIMFIEDIQSKAKFLDIVIKNSTYELPGYSEGSNKYLEFKFNTTISGPYNKVKRFLWEVENSMGRLVKVSSMEIVPPITDQDGNMTMKLTLSTFFSSWSTGLNYGKSKLNRTNKEK